MNRILEANKLSVTYNGGFMALNAVSFYVDECEIVAFVGMNGAGKSTALKAVCGLAPINGGSISAFGQQINGLSVDKLVAKGLTLVPEGRRIFSTMSVLENIEMGAFTVVDKEGTVVKKRKEKVYNLFPILFDRKRQVAGTLSGGEQQMLAIGRALMLEPRLLLLDEPSVGLSPNYVEKVFEKLIEINKLGTSILLVEQNVKAALQICHRGYMFESGLITYRGTAEFLQNNERLKSLFLGR